MNFSVTKTLSKTLSLVIALSMMATMLTGCFGKSDDTQPTEPPLNLPTAPATEPVTTVPETQPQVTEPDEDMATILNELHVRRSPSESAPEMGTLYAGDKVKIIDTQTSLGVTWGLIEIPNSDKEGWICMEFVQWNKMPEKPSTEGGEGDSNEGTGSNAGSTTGSDTVVAKGTVTASTLNIRREPTTTAQSVGSLDNGDRVEILEKKNNWGRIKEGWISLSHVKLDNGTTGSNSGSTGNTGSTGSSSKPSTGNGSSKVISRGVVYNTENLNIRKGPSVDEDRVGSLRGGDRVEIYEKSGNWGRIDKGWISLGYVYIDGTGIGDNRYGVVTGNELNIRSGPGTKYDRVGSLNEGDKVTILFRVDVGDTTWGNIKQGWISMDYVDLDGDDSSSSSDDVESDGNTKVLYRGIVTASTLTIRKDADGDSDRIGSYPEGTRVEILEEDGDWGRTKKGWISLEYVYVDGTGSGGDYGIITEDINVRSGPGTDYDIVGSMDEGDEVEILYEVDVNGTAWGNTEDGWVCMRYVDMD